MPKNNDGNKPLHLAITFEFADIALLLIDKGADINAKNHNGNTPLHFALEHKLVDIARLLIDNGADIHAKDKYGDTPLHFAIEYKLADIARLLIDKGTDIHAINKYGDTPLHNTIEYKLADIAQLLIDNGADIHTKDKYGDTLLHFAINCNLVDIAQLLIEKGVYIHDKNYIGDTLLHLAIEYKLVDISRLLIEKGADIHAKNINGDTPLHIAVRQKFVDIIQLLIENGVDNTIKNTIKNNNGWVPGMVKYEKEKYRILLDNLIKFVSNIITRRMIDGKLRLRFKNIFLGSFSAGRFYACANTIKDLYLDELQSTASSLGCTDVLSKREYCKYISERLEAYSNHSSTYLCNIYRSVIGVTVILQNDVDFLHEPIEDSRELYILLDANGRYYGFSREDYQYLEKCKINPHSTSRLTEEHIEDIDSFFKKFDGIDCDYFENLLK